jgi:hypothetical protein
MVSNNVPFWSALVSGFFAGMSKKRQRCAVVNLENIYWIDFWSSLWQHHNWLRFESVVTDTITFYSYKCHLDYFFQFQFKKSHFRCRLWSLTEFGWWNDKNGQNPVGAPTFSPICKIRDLDRGTWRPIRPGPIRIDISFPFPDCVRSRAWKRSK